MLLSLFCRTDQRREPERKLRALICSWPTQSQDRFFSPLLSSPLLTNIIHPEKNRTGKQTRMTRRICFGDVQFPRQSRVSGSNPAGRGRYVCLCRSASCCCRYPATFACSPASVPLCCASSRSKRSVSRPPGPLTVVHDVDAAGSQQTAPKRRGSNVVNPWSGSTSPAICELIYVHQLKVLIP